MISDEHTLPRAQPVVIGAVSLAVIALLILAAFRAQDLPLIGGGDTYYAAFTESGGLKANDEVRIAGVRVGKVESVELDGDHVKVTFQVETDSELRRGDRSRDQGEDAARRHVPRAGAGRRRPARRRAPRSRSSAPARRTTSSTRSPAWPRPPSRSTPTSSPTSLTTLADLTRNTPEEFRGALDGCLAAVAEHRRPRRPDQHAAQEPRAGLERPRRPRRGHRRADGGRRRAVPRAGRAARGGPQPAGLDLDLLSTELTALVEQTRADLKPALDAPRAVVHVLNKNEDNLDNSLRLMAPFYRVFANTLGNGPWFDTYIQNMPPVPQVGG